MTGPNIQCFLSVVGCCGLACITKLGYEPERRQFESVMARHNFNNLQTITEKTFQVYHQIATADQAQKEAGVLLLARFGPTKHL